MIKVKQNVVSVSDMKDGDIGVMTDIGIDYYSGRIIQRYEDDLIVVGEHSDRSLKDFFKQKNNPDRKTRLFNDGEILIYNKL